MLEREEMIDELSGLLTHRQDSYAMNLDSILLKMNQIISEHTDILGHNAVDLFTTPVPRNSADTIYRQLKREAESKLLHEQLRLCGFTLGITALGGAVGAAGGAFLGFFGWAIFVKGNFASESIPCVEKGAEIGAVVLGAIECGLAGKDFSDDYKKFIHSDKYIKLKRDIGIFKELSNRLHEVSITPPEIQRMLP